MASSNPILLLICNGKLQGDFLLCFFLFLRVNATRYKLYVAATAGHGIGCGLRVRGPCGGATHIVEGFDLDLDLVLVIAGRIDALIAMLLLLLGNDIIPALAHGRGGGLVGALPLLPAPIVLAIDQQLRLEGVFANVLILVRVAVVKHEASDAHERGPALKLKNQIQIQITLKSRHSCSCSHTNWDFGGGGISGL